MKHEVIITEDQWVGSIYRTRVWEESVTITWWEHDYQKKHYLIRFIDGVANTGSGHRLQNDVNPGSIPGSVSQKCSCAGTGRQAGLRNQ